MFDLMYENEFVMGNLVFDVYVEYLNEFIINIIGKEVLMFKELKIIVVRNVG